MKVTIVQCEAKAFDSKKDGKPVAVVMCAGFGDDGCLYEWSAPEGTQHKVVRAVKYDPKQVEEVNLQVRIFQGKIKYREVPLA